MSEFIIPSCPNWFLSDCMCVGGDGYIVYGTISVGIAIVAPGRDRFSFRDFKIIQSAHKSRLSSLSLSTDWIESRLFVSGADDGFVKLWNAETLICKIGQNIHFVNNEEIASVGFLNPNLVVSVGNLGFVVTWNIKTNTIQTNTKVLKGYKATCMAVCPHKDKVFAVGTKKGTVIVLSVLGDYNDTIKILFKLPGHDSEISSLSWCPTLKCSYFDNFDPTTFNVESKFSKKKKIKSKDNDVKEPEFEERIDDQEPVSIDKEPTPEVMSKDTDENNKTVDSENRFENDDPSKESNDDDEEISKDDLCLQQTTDDFLRECSELLKLINSRKKDSDSVSKPRKDSGMSKKLERSDVDESEVCDKFNEKCAIISEDEKTEYPEEGNSSLNDTVSNAAHSGADENCFDDSDLFDMYKDDTMEEFGHSRSVAAKEIEREKDESRKIIKAKKTHSKTTDDKLNVETLDEKPQETDAVESLSENVSSLKIEEDNLKDENDCYLASCCKKGVLCVWKWGGSLMMSQEIKNFSDPKAKVTHPFGAVLWVEPTKIIVAAKDSQLVCFDFEYGKKYNQLHHSHKRGLFKIVTNPRSLMEGEKSVIWTASMDRLLAGYSFDDGAKSIYSTFGGQVQDIKMSPIDSKIFAVGSMDGMVRVWRLQANNGVFQSATFLRQFWNGITGKICSLAWNPEKENCLAFSTMEGRVGLINTSSDAPSRLLPLSFPLGVHKIFWGPPHLLYACGGDKLVVFKIKENPIASERISVTVSNESWKVTMISWSKKYLTVGSSTGGIALLNPSHPYNVIASKTPYWKSITSIAWHPTAVTSEDGVSQWSDLIAVSSKSNNIIVLKAFTMNGITMLETFRDYMIHTDAVTCLQWSPHHNGQLLSASQDNTVQIWDVLANCHLHTFADHQFSVNCATWCGALPGIVLSGSSDYSLKIWNIDNFPPAERKKKNNRTKKKMVLSTFKTNENKSNDARPGTDVKTETVEDGRCQNEQEPGMAVLNKELKKAKRRKIVPLTLFWKQFNRGNVEGCRRLFDRVKAEKSGDDKFAMDYSNECDYLRIFGRREDVMELLDMEEKSHKEKFYWDAWACVNILKGDVKTVIETAKEQGKLTASLLSIAPSVSHKFWKEMMAHYGEQFVVEQSPVQQDYLLDGLGRVWQAMLSLCTGQVDKGCFSLGEIGQEAEAVSAARARHMDHIADRHIELWSEYLVKTGNNHRAIECYLAMGRINEAASLLGKSNDEEDLALAASMSLFAKSL